MIVEWRCAFLFLSRIAADERMQAKRSIMDVLKTVEEALPDYFSEAGDESD